MMSSGSNRPPRVLVLGAHPDDAEFHAGGLLWAHARRGADIKLVSVTNGGAGHHERSSEELVVLRRREAGEAGDVLGVPYETWDFPDASLLPTLDLRHRIIREIRTFHPDLVLTHRTCDYHPDHRAVGQAVQDASYLVTVPLVVPEVPHLQRDPVVAYMVDLFTRPYPLQPHVVMDVGRCLDTIVRMLACHSSQVFEFLPYNQGIPDRAPEGELDRLEWLSEWFKRLIAPRADRFRAALLERYGQRGADVAWVEAYEISEYAGRLSEQQVDWLFPDPVSIQV